MAKKKTTKRKKRSTDTNLMGLSGKSEALVENAITIIVILLATQYATAGTLEYNSAVVGGLSVATVASFKQTLRKIVKNII